MQKDSAEHKTTGGITHAWPPVEMRFKNENFDLVNPWSYFEDGQRHILQALGNLQHQKFWSNTGNVTYSIEFSKSGWLL